MKYTVYYSWNDATTIQLSLFEDQEVLYKLVLELKRGSTVLIIEISNIKVLLRNMLKIFDNAINILEAIYDN